MSTASRVADPVAKREIGEYLEVNGLGLVPKPISIPRYGLELI